VDQEMIFYVTHTVRVLTINISTDGCTYQNAVHVTYQTPTSLYIPDALKTLF